MNYLGVDLGLSGAITLLDKDDRVLVCEPMPVKETIVNKKTKNQYDIDGIYRLLLRLNQDYKMSACMERLRPMPNQMSQTAFSLGAGTMLFKTLFTVLSIPYLEVEPRVWQKEMFKGINYTSKETKIASVMVANRLFPGFSFKKTERCKVDSDGMTDSALIGLYLKKIN